MRSGFGIELRYAFPNFAMEGAIRGCGRMAQLGISVCRLPGPGAMLSEFAYLWLVYFEAGIATVIGPSWSHTKNAINFAGSVWLAFADTR